LSLRLGVSQAITNRLHYSHSDFNKTTKQKIGPPADTVIVTSSEITAREPQQNPVLVFSITLTQKRVRPPVWIILVLYAELASVKTLLVKGLYHSNLPSTLELVCDVPSLLHAHTQTEIRKYKYKFPRTLGFRNLVTSQLTDFTTVIVTSIKQQNKKSGLRRIRSSKIGPPADTAAECTQNHGLWPSESTATDDLSSNPH